jgi:hypothetical protein
MLQFVLQFSFTSSNSVSTKNVQVYEWLSTFDPRIRDQRGLWIGAGSIVVSIACLATGWRRLNAVNTLMFLMFLALALKVNRFLVYMGFAAIFVIPPLIPARWREEEFQLKLYILCVFLSSGILALALRFGNAFNAYPHQAWGVNQSLTRFMVKTLEDPALKGNVITSYGYGAELVYRAYPRLRPSIDSRIDSYGDAYNELNERLFLEDGLLREFSMDYQVRYMLLNYPNFKSIERLESWKEGLWKIRAMDTRTILLERTNVLSPLR